MNLKISLFAVAFLASNAFADFSGTWTGSTQILFSQQIVFNCPAITYTIEQTATSLVMNQAQTACDNGMTLNASTTTLEIQGQSVMYQGQVIGTITDTSLVAHYVDQSKGETLDAKMTRESNVLTMEENATSPQGPMQLKADLKKQ